VAILLWALAAIFCLKIVWNLGVPYELLRRRLKADTGAVQGISLAPALETAVLILIVVLSAVSTGDSWIETTSNVVTWGLILVAGSYLHLLLASFLVGWILSVLRRQRKL
jgi:hypothetical protein